MSLPCPVQINSLSTRVSDKNATQTKRMLCCKCLKCLKMYTHWPQLSMYSEYLIFTPGSPCGLIPSEASENETWVRTWTTRLFRERTKKKSSHSTNLFKYIQYKSIHIHYSAADITKSNVTKNPVGKVGERKKN